MMKYIEIIQPHHLEIICGPLQVILRVSTDIQFKSIRLDFKGNHFPSVVQGQTGIFLLPPPDEDILYMTVHLLSQNNEPFHEHFSLHIQRIQPDYHERPYEFLGAKLHGFSLTRTHIYGSGPPNSTPHEETLNLIKTYAGSPILDVGCGIGAYIKALNDCGYPTCGIESNAAYVDQALSNNLDVRLYSGKTLPFSSNTFDTVMAIEVLEHVDSWENLLNEMIRVAKRRVLVTTPNIGVLSEMHRYGVVPWHILESTHYHFFTAEIWRHVIHRLHHATGFVFSYSQLKINDGLFDIQLFVVIEKTHPT
ncbi:MAG: class I SAM-dependent methyltransferase [Desulfobacterales bacterium]|nr:class I SAM-dependent methyltransferase [Desulfobacterales bacterium]